ncbi:hypothetical protein GCM10009087_30920 [Sphingomonas oligophenolica]|uniref:DUF4365 domain-containing protein n=1 Tax=Sphingomonas oligophenolica TaxID=301154 RepID=A0ABU9Y6L4_9SPHN
MAKRPLDSEELGRKGEGRLEDICVDAKLVPNRVKVDRKGWDYLVEWHHPETDHRYDERDPSISCRVQVKTVWEGAKSIKLRLSSAEALATDHRPAFIYIVEVSDALQFSGAYIIHLRGRFLEDLLRKLREARVIARAPTTSSSQCRSRAPP